ncbi:TonB-dependent receptor [Sphingomonas sp. URHD0057]|uniref:TonB-dependent receptor n=1 Tax=Sphingomonas sp. URHD0057 TaxID=1380389 RepID=UPI00068440D5|nr:TonB-dependent receptor [Sphingomonas sp. URHD0057]
MSAISAPAFAQTAEPPVAPAATSAEKSPAAANEDAVQPDIIITAQKRSQRLLDVPQSVSVISSETLENQHAQRLSDYLTRIPSANVVESQSGSSRIVLRGINTGGVGATVATYIDEAPFGSATALANGGVLAPDLDPFDLDRVEVLRGPQGTLYGANSLGGLVKFVTVTPNPREFAAAGEIGVESVAHGDIGYDGRLAANIPFGTDAAMRATGFYRSDPGYIDDPAHGSDVNDGKTYGGRLSIMARPSPALRIRASALMQNIRSNGTNIVDLDPVTLEPTLGKYTHQRVIDEPNDIDYRLYNATIDYDFGPVALVSATSYGTLKQAGVVDASGVYGALLTQILGVPLGAGLDQGMRQRRFTEEVRLASTDRRMIEWTLGGFYTHESNRLAQNLFGIDALSGDRIASLDGLLIAALPSRYRELAGFANATWHIAPRFDLTAGGRYSHNRQSSEQNTSGFIVGPPISFGGKSSDSAFTYSVAPQFKPNRNTTIYARVAKGYRPGGPNAVSPLAPDAVPREFGPDSTTNYEVGVKTQTADHLLSLEVTAFQIDWKDVQLLVQIAGIGVNANGDGARSKGIEFTAGANPSRFLSLYANGSYVDAYLTDDAPLAGGFKGDPLPYNPKWQGTIGAEYQHPLSGSLTGRAGISWHYTGGRSSDFTPPPAPPGQRRLDSFSQIDAHAGVDVGKFRVNAFVRNLTGAKGIVNLGFFGATNGDVAAAVIMPRTVGLSLGARY